MKVNGIVGNTAMKKIYQIFASLVFLVIMVNNARGTTYYSRGAGGNWNLPATWSTVACNGAAAITFPGSTDDVIICNSYGTSSVTVTVNGNYTCNNLTIGTGAPNATLAFGTGPYTFIINGNLSFNTGNGVGIYTLTAGTSTATVNGTVNWNTVNGTNRFLASSGTLNFAQDISIDNINQLITLSAAGKINFTGSFTDKQNKLGTYAACSVRFSGNYIVTDIPAVWNAGAFAVFLGTGKTITPNANITFGNVTIDANAGITSSSSTGVTNIARDLSILGSASLTLNANLTVGYGVTLAASSLLTLNANIQIARAWTNNGGTLSGGTYNVRFTGYSYIIGGTAATAFPNLFLGVSGSTARVAYTQNAPVTCLSFTLENNSYANTSSYSLGASNPSLAIAGDLTINQLTAAKAISLYVNGGSCTVSGNLIFAGTGTASAAQVTQVVSTTGSFTLDGTITWLNQTGTALVATELIQTTSGSLTFNSSVSMPVGSGSIKAAGAGTINFNGNSAPSLDYNSAGVGTVYAIMSAVSGSTVNFKKGITNSYTLTFAAGSTQTFTGAGTINPIAALKFGHFNIGSGITVTAGGNFALQNTWNNSGTFVPGAYVVTFNGASTAVQTITRPAGETFYGLSVTTASGTLTLANNVLVTGSLSMTGHKIDLGGNTLTLGNGSGASMNRTAGQIYNGIYKRYWPASTAVTTATLNKYGLFPIGISTVYRPVLIASTVSPTSGGYVQVSHNGIYSVTDVSYNDGVNAIQRVSDQTTTITTTGVAGGTYSLDVYFGGFNATGAIADLKLEIAALGSWSAVGTHATTTGTVAAPTVKRTALTVSQLNNTFVVGTKNKTTTPIVNYYYSRVATGDWNNTTSWSSVSGGAGASCSCIPPSTSSAVISSGQTINISADASIDYLTIQTGATLIGTANLTVGKELNLAGTGNINPSAGNWTIADMNFIGSGTSYSSATITVNEILDINAASGLTMNAGLTVSGDININGTLSIGSNTATFSGAATRTIGGTGVITGSGGTVAITTASKAILPSSNLSITPNITLANSIVLTNSGTITLLGNLSGGNAGSGWINASGSVLNVEGTVMATGSLTASGSPNTVNYKKAGAQTIKNTTYDRLLCSSSGTKTLAGNVVVNDFLGIYNSVILDESTYTITGAGDLEMTGTPELKLQRGSSGTYPELNGTYNLAGGIITINQTAGTATIQGEEFDNLKLNGTGTYNVADVSLVRNNLNVINSAVMSNLGDVTIQGTFTYSSSATTTLSGDLTTGSFLISSGTLNAGAHDFTVTGSSFTKNGGTFTTTGAVYFSGSAAQTIAGSSATTFHQVILNNVSGLTLSQPITINDDLELVAGRISTDDTNILTINDNATVTQNSLSTFVNGPMRKIGDDAFIFPTGDGSKLGRVGISAPASSATIFKAEYNAVEYGNPETVTYPLAWASHLEHWLLDRTGSTSGIEITLYWEDAAASMIDNCNVLTIAHWNGSTWQEEAATATGSCSDGAGRITTDFPMYSYSPYTFGSNDPHDNPLPVTLINFDAEENSGNVEVKWATASEANNDFFTVERSSDGINFGEITKQNGAGNSNTTINYSVVDFKPLQGISYYRLKQTDFNGKYTYSDVVPVQIFTQFRDMQLAHIFPTPSTEGVIGLQLNEEFSGRILDLKVFDTRGKVVLSKKIDSPDTNGKIQLNHQLIPGAYFLVIDSNGLMDRIPVMILE